MKSIENACKKAGFSQNIDMAILDVLQYPDERLRLVAKPVDDFGPETQRDIDDMFETMATMDNAGAYAAIQMNIQKRIVVFNAMPGHDEPFCVINPEIVEQEGEVFEPEGCMSVPLLYAPVKRAAWVHAKGLDREGNPVEYKTDGYLSRCFQHEIDHLNGILFVDHLSPFKRRRFEKKLAKYQKQTRAK